jgi:hypothetical protein
MLKSQHHRKPKSLGGKSNPENVIWLEDKKHLAWHTLFSNMTPYEIATEINKFYLDPDYVFVHLKKGNRK